MLWFGPRSQSNALFKGCSGSKRCKKDPNRYLKNLSLSISPTRYQREPLQKFLTKKLLWWFSGCSRLNATCKPLMNQFTFPQTWQPWRGHVWYKWFFVLVQQSIAITLKAVAWHGVSSSYGSNGTNLVVNVYQRVPCPRPVRSGAFWKHEDTSAISSSWF